ncbi:MAG: 2-hydroxyacyl-CoA dehydratase subunit D [Candidatus Ratteibacteria bacterium]
MQKKFLSQYREILRKNLKCNSPDSENMSARVFEYMKKSNLSSMEGFYQAILDFGRNGIDISEKPIGFFCNVVPEEIMLAGSLRPVRLCCEEYECGSKGEEIVPGDICPVIKSICGKFYSNSYDNLEVVVIPGTCDPKAKLAEILSPVKQVYFLDTGRDSEYLANVDIWEKKYTQFFQFLKETFHCSAGRRQLLSACKLTNARTEVFRNIYQLRAEQPDAINVFDYYIMMYAGFFMKVEKWNALAEKVYRQAKQIHRFVDKPRILLAGTPVIFPNFKIIDVMEESGLKMAADLQCISFGRFYNPVMIDEETEAGILRALTLKNIAGSMCPCLLNLEKLVNLIIDTVNQYKLDGVIYYNLRLCQVFELQTALIRQILKEKGIPFLSIKTDLGKEDTGQLKTRMEAFREMIESRNE